MSRSAKAALPAVKSTGLVASVKVGAPSGVTAQTKAPLINTQKRVGTSNLTRNRWPSAPHIMGNHK